MVAIPFGLSVHHFISTVGADVGFASLIGLALLVLLFFSQARETATLRARADEANLRIQELEGELAELSDQVAALPAEISVRAASPRVAAAFGAGHAAAAAGGGGAGTMLIPAAPAGVAAPALAAATRLIPDPDPDHRPEYEPATAGGHSNGSARPVVAASAATMERPVQARVANAPRPVAAPSRVGGGGPARGPGAGQGRPAGAGPGRQGGAGQGRPSGPGQPRYGGPARPSGAPTRPAARRSRGRLVLGALVALLAVAAVGAGVFLLTKGTSGSSSSRSSTGASLASHRTSSLAAVQPASVTVSVLNGTDQVGLAGDISKRLIADGYRKGGVANASDQTQASTVVAYMEPVFRRDALAVATSLKLPTSSVQLIDANTKAIACPPNQPCTSAVVVTVGKNLATQ
jgi:LytR cell envelope-related transcriptional attenuator